MKYTLQIAFSKPVGDILLRVCEYQTNLELIKQIELILCYLIFQVTLLK